MCLPEDTMKVLLNVKLLNETSYLIVFLRLNLPQARKWVTIVDRVLNPDY